MCTVYVYSVLCTLFSSAAEICARLAGNYCLSWLTTAKSGPNDLVWFGRLGGEGELGRERQGEGVAFPPLGKDQHDSMVSCDVFTCLMVIR